MARYGGSWESDQYENRVAGDGHAYAELGHQELRCPHVRCEDVRCAGVFRDVSIHVGYVRRPDVGREDIRLADVRDLFPSVQGLWCENIENASFKDTRLEGLGDVACEDVGDVRRAEIRDHDHDHDPAQDGRDAYQDGRDAYQDGRGACRYGQRAQGGGSGSGAEPAREGHAHPDARDVLCR